MTEMLYAGKVVKRVNKTVARKAFEKGKLVVCQRSGKQVDICFHQSYQRDKQEDEFLFDNLRGQWFTE